MAGRFLGAGRGELRRSPGHQHPGRFPQRLPGWLPRALRRPFGGGGPAACAGPVGKQAAGHEFLPAADAGWRAHPALQAVPRRHPSGAVGRTADSGKSRPARAGRVPLSTAPRQWPRILDSRLRLHLQRRPEPEHSGAQRHLPGCVHPHRRRRCRKRCLQPPGADSGPALARRGVAACLCTLPETNPSGLRPGLHRQHAEQPHRHRARAYPPVQDAFLPGPQTDPGRPRGQAAAA